MPAPVGAGSIQVAQYTFKSSTQNDTETEEAAKGKSAQSPGHMAKTAIEALKLEDAPANLHGKVTSAYAHGAFEIDIASLIALQSDEPSDVEDGSAPVADTQTAAEQPASSETEASVAVESEPVGSSQPGPATEDPAALTDSELVDLLYASLNEDAP